MTLESLDFLCIGIYLIAIVLIGSAFSRGQSSTKDYFLAGKSVPWWAVSISMYASLFSSVSYVMAPAEAFRNDLQYLVALACFPIASVLAIILFVDFFLRLQVTTIFEYLEKRFNIAVSLLLLTAYSLFRCIYAGIVVYSLSLVLHVTMDLPLVETMVCVGAGAIVYTMLGGMKAVIWTDVLQFFVVVGGILLSLLLAVREIPGGVTEVLNIADEHEKLRLVNTSFDLKQQYVVWTLIAFGIVDFLGSKGVDQMSLQRYLSARSPRDAKKALFAQSLFSLPVWLLLFSVGTCLFAYYHHNPSPVVEQYIAANQYDRIFPRYIFEVMPVGIRGFMVAALLAAAMSTMDSVLHVLSTISVVNIYQRYVNTSATDVESLQTARRLIVAWGIVIIAAAILMQNVSSILTVVNSVIALFVGPTMGVMLLGMFSRRANWQGVLIGMLCGSACGYVLKFHTEYTFTILGFSTLAIVLLIGRVSSEFFPPPNPNGLGDLMWKWRGWREALFGGASPSDSLSSNQA